MKMDSTSLPSRSGEAAFDFALSIVTVLLVFNRPEFLGGWGWFLLLGLSPRAWRTRL